LKTRKAPKGSYDFPWSLYIGTFRRIHFINPPEVYGLNFQSTQVRMNFGKTNIGKVFHDVKRNKRGNKRGKREIFVFLPYY
jgi:hypothetical protein